MRAGWLSAAVFALAGFVSAPGRAAAQPLKFQFGAGPGVAGYAQVRPETAFDPKRGYGFEPGAQLVSVENRAAAANPLAARSVASDQPFYFSARVPAEGNYRVRAILGRSDAATSTTIKAELRRLMVERVRAAAGEFTTVEFVVNVRSPRIAAANGVAAGSVKLKSPRESVMEAWAWDDLLTLEFDGPHPALCALELEPVTVPTVYLLGDSTVCDQPREPFSSWGQSLPNFFRTDVAIANHAESGETYRDSIGRRRLDKIVSLLRPGDYVLMQFGHNDQKQIAPGTGGPFTTYKAEIRKHVEAIRERGATPVIVSPMERRNFNPDGTIRPTLTDYAEASRQAAQELHVAFLDLHAASILFYQALGADRAYLAFAGRGKTRDATHHDNYGSYELARIVVQEIREAGLPLAAHVKAGWPDFDPRHPDAPESFALPESPLFTNQRPLGD